MTEIVKLADPSIGALQAIADGGVDVTIRVAIRHLEWAWARLGEIMDAEPSSRRRTWAEDGHTEEELRLLCGLFSAVANAIPMNPSNFIDWLRVLDSDALDGFVTWHLAQMEDEQLREVLSCVLRDKNLDNLGLERIEDPVRRGGRMAA